MKVPEFDKHLHSIMSESDILFHKQYRRCTAVQLMLSTDPCYDNRTIYSTFKMQIWMATNNRDVPRLMKTKLPVTVMVFGLVSSEGYIMPSHIFKVGLKVNTKVYLDVLKSVVIPWCNQMASGRSRNRPTNSKRPRLVFRRSATTLYSSLTAPSPVLNPLDYFVWSYVEKITNMTSHNTKPSLITQYWSSSRRCLWKRLAPSSGSVSRRWLRLKAATLNRCQLYFIIKFAELIFSIKVLK